MSTYRVAEANDIERLGRMLHLAFGTGSAQDSLDWVERLGLEQIRVIDEGAGAVACAAVLPMGQFFGGRSVPMQGVAGVAVPPESRGRGVATRLMNEIMAEVRSCGAPISTLYPATLPLYRRAGYEIAGHFFSNRIRLRNLSFRDADAPVREVAEADLPAIRELSREFARAHDGCLDRSDYIWDRIVMSRDRKSPIPGLVVEPERGRIEGYMFYSQAQLHADPAPCSGRTVLVNDVCAVTGRAATRLLGVACEMSSMCDELRVRAGPVHPFMLRLPERAFHTSLMDPWMVRLVDVAGAIAARGYSPAIDAEVHLRLEDDVLPDNAGDWVLRVSDGSGRLGRGGRGDVRLHLRQLATVYSGFASPGQLAQIGLIEGDERVIGLLGAVFAGPTPWMADQF